MNDKPALIPTSERFVDFYGDDLLAILVDDEPFIALKPICDYLGLAWNAQYERVQRDPVLSEVAQLVRITEVGKSGGRPEYLCLPLKYLNGWLFGISVSRVKESLRDRIMQYQRDCYDVLAQAFQNRSMEVRPSSQLMQIRELGLAIAQMAEQQMALENRMYTTESRLDKAAQVVGDISKRLRKVETALWPGERITEEQAADLSLRVKALAGLLSEQDTSGKKNHYQGVFVELYRRFGVSNYKAIALDQFAQVLAFLDEWRQQIEGNTQTG
jgi:hypothetical protein